MRPALHQVTACTPQIDGLPTRTDVIGELNDRYAITTLVQPEGQRRPCDSGAADHDGRLCHGR
jgi:hypothetical protein